MNIELWIAGSCDQDSTKKKHAGGWCASIVTTPLLGEITIKGSSQDTTTYRMKLTAALEGLLKVLMEHGNAGELNITIYSDHIYIVHAFNAGWVDGWLERGRHRGILMKAGHNKKSGSRVLENSDLWWILIYLVKKFNVKFVFVSPNSTLQNINVRKIAIGEMRDQRSLMGGASEPTELKEGKAKKFKALKEGRLSYTTLHERKLKK